MTPDTRDPLAMFDSLGHDLRDQMEMLTDMTIEGLEADIMERRRKIEELRAFRAGLRALTLPVIGLPALAGGLRPSSPPGVSDAGDLADDEIPAFLKRQDQPPPPRMALGERLAVHIARALGGSLAVSRTAG
jgi:hypothetical protein